MAKRKHSRINKRGHLMLTIRHAARLAECIFGAGKGAEKRKWVATTINNAVDIPFLNEKQEQATLELLIDLVVGQLNRGGGWGAPGKGVPSLNVAPKSAEA